MIMDDLNREFNGLRDEIARLKGIIHIYEDNARADDKTISQLRSERDKAENALTQVSTKSINELAKEYYENSKSKGFWDNPRNVGEMIALMHSELSEALEELRNGRPLTEIYYEVKQYNETTNAIIEKPCGFGVELADCMIRIMESAYGLGIDLEKALKLKHEYNKTRLHKHGKEF